MSTAHALGPSSVHTLGANARGKVALAGADLVIFSPAGTNYAFHLVPAGGGFRGPADTLVEVNIRVQARKLYTVPSGGNFVQPIVGPPRIVQGRIREVTNDSLILHAGCPIEVIFPPRDDQFDLGNGGLRAGAMANATCLPGATIEFIRAVTGE
jgi:hypothetical protein